MASKPPPESISASTNRRARNFIFLTVLWFLSFMVLSDALRMINLDAPQIANQGDTIQLSCSYSLTDGRQNSAVGLGGRIDAASERSSGAGGSHGRSTASARAPTDGDRLSSPRIDGAGYQIVEAAEVLYAVKWYKDEREFFRYLTQDWPHKQALSMESLDVDVDKSDNQTVVLKNVSLETSGSFRCEVSTDAPSFLTKSIERRVLIYSLPTEGPQIEPTGTRRIVEGRQLQHLGDQQEFTCISHESKPAAHLDWILNEQINLTSEKPLTPEGQPIFTTQMKNLVRLPATPRQAERSDQARANAPTRGATRASYATYVLDQPVGDNTRGVVAKPLETNSSLVDHRAVPLDSDARDQLPESTISKLNFTIDANLIKLLSECKHEQSHKISDSIWQTKRANSTKSNSLRGSKKPNAAVAGGGQNRSVSARILVRIRCVARVMHLKMSDEIRLIAVDRKRGVGPAQNSAMVDSRARDTLKSSAAIRTTMCDLGNLVVTMILLWKVTKNEYCRNVPLINIRIH